MSFSLPIKSFNKNVTSAIEKEKNFIGQILISLIVWYLPQHVIQPPHYFLKKKKKKTIPLKTAILWSLFHLLFQQSTFGTQTSLFLDFLPQKKFTNITKNDPPNFPFSPLRYFWELNFISTSQICLFLFLSSLSETSKQLPPDLLFTFRK